MVGIPRYCLTTSWSVSSGLSAVINCSGERWKRSRSRHWDDTPAHGAGIIDLTLIVVLHESVQDIGERLSVAGEEGRSAQHGAADRTAVGVAAGGLVHENL